MKMVSTHRIAAESKQLTEIFENVAGTCYLPLLLPLINRSCFLSFIHSLGHVSIYLTSIYQASTMYLLGTSPDAGSTELRIATSLSLSLTIHAVGMMTASVYEVQ